MFREPKADTPSISSAAGADFPRSFIGARTQDPSSARQREGQVFPPVSPAARRVACLPKRLHDFFERFLAWPQFLERQKRERLVDDVQERQEIVAVRFDV